MASIVPNFFKYTILAIAFQFVVCVGIWAFAFFVSTSLAEPVLEGLVYFYFPLMWLSSVVGVRGEFGGFLFGFFWGSIFYGIAFGAIVCGIKRLRRA